jgi:hypothetical protein
MVSREKDNSSISDHVYHNFRKNLNLENILPTNSKIRKLRNLQNSEQNVLKNNFGVFVDIKSKLIKEISIKLETNQLIIVDNKIKLKFCGDGAQVSKKLTIFNFSFAIISDKKNCKTVTGHSIVGVFQITESYENLKNSLEQIILQIENLKKISVNQHEFDLDIKFANDLKVTSLLMGISAANSKYPCPYCKISFPTSNKGQFSENEKEIREFKKTLLEKDWNLDTRTDSSEVCYRTQDEAVNLIRESTVDKKKGLNKFCYEGLNFLNYLKYFIRIQAHPISKIARL